MKLTVRTGPIVKSSSLRLSASSFNLETRGVFDQFCRVVKKKKNTHVENNEDSRNQKDSKVVSPEKLGSNQPHEQKA